MNPQDAIARAKKILASREKVSPSLISFFRIH